MSISGKAFSIDPESNSMSPAMRSAFHTTSCSTTWLDGTGDIVRQTVHDWAKIHFSPFGDGMYLNEPDYYEENWRTKFWESIDCQSL